MVFTEVVYVGFLPNFQCPYILWNESKRLNVRLAQTIKHSVNFKERF